MRNEVVFRTTANRARGRRFKSMYAIHCAKQPPIINLRLDNSVRSFSMKGHEATTAAPRFPLKLQRSDKGGMAVENLVYYSRCTSLNKKKFRGVSCVLYFFSAYVGKLIIIGLLLIPCQLVYSYFVYSQITDLQIV